MQEIGGYLQLDDFTSNEYYKNLVSLNTARNYFVYLCKAKNISKVYLPYFLCDSVSEVCVRENICYEYYHINSDFTPIFNEKLSNNEYLYIVNYYGQLTNEQILSYQQMHQNIILDNVQAFFQKPLSGIDTIYSCRKFFGVPDGAYLSTDTKINYELAVDVSKDRMKHILGRYEGKSASDYYDDFKENDHSFIGLPLMYMSKLTHNILGAIDYEKVIEKRNENYRVLSNGLDKINELKFVKPYAPFVYPFYCENGMFLRKKLAEKKIFIPTLWPNILDFDSCELEKDYALNILPIPVDQRYSVNEMEKISQYLKLLTNKLND